MNRMEFFESAPGLPLVTNGELAYNKGDETALIISLLMFFFAQYLIHCACRPNQVTLYRH
jgi:hypothetical protein